MSVGGQERPNAGAVLVTPKCQLRVHGGFGSGTVPATLISTAPSATFFPGLSRGASSGLAADGAGSPINARRDA